MRTNCCYTFLAFNLRFLNFLQFFVGISTVIYSAYLLNHWQNQAPVIPSPNYLLSHYSNAEFLEVVVNRLHAIHLPGPWFMYFLMAVGGILCCMSCIGHVAAEAFNGFCLCFYILLAAVLILLEAALVAFIAIDQHWEKDLPYDPSGELEKLKSFVMENAVICKWLGLALLTIQALSLLLSFVLRSMISTRRSYSDVEDGYAAVEDRIREPLLTSQPNQSSGSMKAEGRGTLSDIWTTQIRHKYGLNNESTKYQSLDASSSKKS